MLVEVTMLNQIYKKKQKHKMRHLLGARVGLDDDSGIAEKQFSHI